MSVAQAKCIAPRLRLIDDEVMAIVGFVELAKAHAGGDELLLSDLEEIRRAAFRAIRKTNTLDASAKGLEPPTRIDHRAVIGGGDTVAAATSTLSP